MTDIKKDPTPFDMEPQNKSLRRNDLTPVDPSLTSSDLFGTTPTMASGFGKHHTNTVTAKNAKPLVGITWSDIRAMVDNPPDTDKDSAQWFIASSLMSRLAAEQERDGPYQGLWSDIDENPKSIAEVHDLTICEIVGPSDFEIHASKT